MISKSFSFGVLYPNRCTDGREIWSPPPCQISPPSVQRVAPAGRQTSKSASEQIKYRRLALRSMLPVTKHYCHRSWMDIREIPPVYENKIIVTRPNESPQVAMRIRYGVEWRHLTLILGVISTPRPFYLLTLYEACEIFPIALVTSWN